MFVNKRVTTTLLQRCGRQTLARQICPMVRSFATAMAEPRGEDMVKATIQKMMLQNQQQSTNGVTQEALHKASYCLQKKLQEVRACLTDVLEEEENRQTEVETTDMALEQAAAAYIDLLDLVREADETTAGQFKELREASALQIREYRQELDQYRQEV